MIANTLDFLPARPEAVKNYAFSNAFFFDLLRFSDFQRRFTISTFHQRTITYF
jgi:hypothetical protein